MHRSILAAFLLVVLGLAAPATAAGAAPSCFGKPATHVMQPGEGSFFGTPGNDVVVGSTGRDHINLDDFGGVDLVCGGAGDDVISTANPASKADGGTGGDVVNATFGGLARGGSGDDFYVGVMGAGGRAEGGSGDDRLIEAYSGATADGGSGNDGVVGFGAAALFGGSGNDTVRNASGTAPIDCGSGRDTVSANGATNVRRCERSL